jgi:HTH-type transcriptional regulator/antitoxin HigA
MTEAIRNQYTPDYVSMPGETLQEVLELRGMSQAELAERTGRPKKTINEIIKGKAAITPETALQLELVLGIPASFWNSREQHYREALARERGREHLEAVGDWLKDIPYRAMVSRGWIPEKREKSQQIQEVLRFFGVATPASWDEVWRGAQAEFRRSKAFKSEPGATAAWLRKGELAAQRIQCPQYDAARFKEVLRSIRAMTHDLPRTFPSVVIRECSAAGVRAVFLPELPGTRVSGATRWLNQTSPLIQLSLRYRTDDHLWFTFFHEAGHILLHGKRDAFLEGDEQEQNEKELEADSFAREWLIPEKQYRAFRRLGACSCAAISRFAYQLGIAPGIVVGRLQHDDVLPPTHCNDLKRRVDWYFEGDDAPD